jgi:hypothetical protein
MTAARQLGAMSPSRIYGAVRRYYVQSGNAAYWTVRVFCAVTSRYSGGGGKPVCFVVTAVRTKNPATQLTAQPLSSTSRRCDRPRVRRTVSRAQPRVIRYVTLVIRCLWQAAAVTDGVYGTLSPGHNFVQSCNVVLLLSFTSRRCRCHQATTTCNQAM